MMYTKLTTPNNDHAFLRLALDMDYSLVGADRHRVHLEEVLAIELCR